MLTVAVIPAFNEENNVGFVAKNTMKYVDKVVVIDDGSTDSTKTVAENAGAFVIRNAINKGKAGAMYVGFDYALKIGANAIVVLDADGQHDPDEIPNLFGKLKEGFDIVVGARTFNTSVMPKIRIFANSFSSYLTSALCHTQILDSQSGYRIIKANVLERITFTSERYQIETEMLIKAAKCGFKIAFIPIKTIYRKEAKSKINQLVDPFKFIWLIFKLSFWRCR